MSDRESRRFHGKRCLVTGSSSGIGAELVHLLLAEGAEVVGLDRAEVDSPAYQRVEVDLSDRASIDAALRRLPGTWDVVCNVAGLDEPDCPAAVFAVNFLAPRHLSESLLRRLRRRGAIVNVASTSSHEWPQHIASLRTLLAAADFDSGAAWFAEHGGGRPAEPLSQEALVAYTKARGPELIPAGLRMNAVSPGPVDTPLLPAFSATMGRDYVDRAPRLRGRHFSATEIARVVAFLASDDALAVNGHNIIADGGLLGCRT